MSHNIGKGCPISGKGFVEKTISPFVNLTKDNKRNQKGECYD